MLSHPLSSNLLAFIIAGSERSIQVVRIGPHLDQVFYHLDDVWVDEINEADGSDDINNIELESSVDFTEPTSNMSQALPLLEWQYRRRNLFDLSFLFASVFSIALLGTLFTDFNFVHEVNRDREVVDRGTALIEWRYRRQNMFDFAAQRSFVPTGATHRNGNGNGNSRRRLPDVFTMNSMRDALDEIEVNFPSPKRQRIL